MAGDEGFEPPNVGTKSRCLTTWRIPNDLLFTLFCGQNLVILPYLGQFVHIFYLLTCLNGGLSHGLLSHLHLRLCLLQYAHMDKVKKQISGFTLIELIVVIAVIGILATIAVVGFGRYQADTRDARRSSSASVIAEGLEKYYDLNGEYPSCAALSASGSAISLTTLIGIEKSTLVSPQAPSADSTNYNSIKCTSSGSTLTTNGVDFFEYQGDGSPECAASGSCLVYTLKYKNETNGMIKTITSRRSTSIATSGNITTLTASPTGFSTINIAWQQVSNAAGYSVQQADDAGFVTNVVLSSTTTPTAGITGLTSGKTYFFRVMAVGVSGSANWSNIANTTTWSLATPVITATSTSGTQITITWPDIQYETSYTLQYSTSGSSWVSPVPTSVTGIPAGTTSYIVGGLSTGVQYFFRLQALAPANTSSWSATANAYTVLPAPICSSNGGSNTQIIPGWGASTGAASYTVQYGPGSYSSQSTGITGTSLTVNGLNNGTTYISQVQAVQGSVTSAWASCPDRTTGVDGPTSAGWSADAYGVRDTSTVAWMPGAYPGAGTYWTNGMNIYGTCQPGATVVVRLYQYYASSSNTSQNTAHLQDWTWNNQDLYVVGGRTTWMVWWQGWVACQVGGTRVGDTYLGNAGPY